MMRPEQLSLSLGWKFIKTENGDSIVGLLGKIPVTLLWLLRTPFKLKYLSNLSFYMIISAINIPLDQKIKHMRFCHPSLGSPEKDIVENHIFHPLFFSHYTSNLMSTQKLFQRPTLFPSSQTGHLDNFSDDWYGHILAINNANIAFVLGIIETFGHMWSRFLKIYILSKVITKINYGTK